MRQWAGRYPGSTATGRAAGSCCCRCSGQSGTTEASWRNEDVHDSLELCLSCKGCKADCPMGVDMATTRPSSTTTSTGATGAACARAKCMRWAFCHGRPGRGAGAELSLVVPR